MAWRTCWGRSVLLVQQHGADVFIVDHQIVLGVDLPDDSLSMVMTPLSRLRQNCRSGLPFRSSSTSVVKPPMSMTKTRDRGKIPRSGGLPRHTPGDRPAPGGFPGPGTCPGRKTSQRPAGSTGKTSPAAFRNAPGAGPPPDPPGQRAPRLSGIPVPGQWRTRSAQSTGYPEFLSRI